MNFKKTSQKSKFPKMEDNRQRKWEEGCTLEESQTPQGPRRKNSTVSPPHTPPLYDDDDEIESSSEEVSFGILIFVEEVNEVLLIARQDPN